ncbi:hypothetical protein [[Eubacterium] cellulosolvens]
MFNPFHFNYNQEIKNPITINNHDSEGINTFYKILGTSLLVCMNNLKSTRFPKSINLIKHTTSNFESQIETRLHDTKYLTLEELLSSRLLKRKHYNYGAYLAALTSLPILSNSAQNKDILSSMIAKTSAISSIKILDNIHDKLVDKKEAVKSQREHLKAFTNNEYYIENNSDFILKAENSCMNMARWTFEAVKQGLNDDSESLQIYRKDFVDYIDGQIRSMDEKSNKTRNLPTIHEYIKKVNEKSVGKIWVDIDFCFLEKALGQLDKTDLKNILLIREAADYFFKGCNLYDDVADLEEDLSLGIFNSVPLLALDRGKIDHSDLQIEKIELMEILKRRGSIDEALQLADLIFLKGFGPLNRAKELNDVADIDALIFGAKILRMFAIRKWAFHQPSLDTICKTALSLGSLRLYHIPEKIAAYSIYA